MKVIKLRVDGQEFYLPPEVDVDALQQQILDAAAGAPAFIRFRPHGHGDVAVLVTAHIPVRFEVEEHTESQVESWSDSPPVIDDFPRYSHGPEGI